MTLEGALVSTSLLLYFLSSAAYHLHLFAGNARARYVALACLILGVVAHTGAIGAYCVTGKSVLGGAMPFSLAAYFIAIAQSLAGFGARWASLGSLAVPLSFVLQFYSAVHAGDETGKSTAGAMLRPHVMLLLFGFAAFTLAFCLAVIYLGQSRLLKTKKIRGPFSRLPPLESVSGAAHWLAVAGFTMLTLGIITGAIAAPASWGPTWYLDSRTLTTVVAWGIYAAYLAASSIMGWRGRRTTYFLIAGFVVVLLAFFASVRHPHGARTEAGVDRASFLELSRSA